MDGWVECLLRDGGTDGWMEGRGREVSREGGRAEGEG